MTPAEMARIDELAKAEAAKAPPLTPAQKALLSRVFDAPLRAHYAAHPELHPGATRGRFDVTWP